MAKQHYVSKKFTPASLAMIETLDSIVTEYQGMGFVLTARQLYYQLVSRNIIPNNERSYKNTCSLLNDARLAGLIDWDMIEDRTRAFTERARWNDGSDILSAVASQFHADLWVGQEERVFVLVEKEALVGVLEGLCNEYDVPLLAARGYPSVSVLRDFAISKILPAVCDFTYVTDGKGGHRKERKNSQDVRILHLGDHDPSGIDMTRDLVDRLSVLCHGTRFRLDRLALNHDQVEELDLPPNPAKLTDSRAEDYIQRFGYESWELDAIGPQYINDLVKEKIEECIDNDMRDKRIEFIEATKEKLLAIADDFEV